MKLSELNQLIASGKAELQGNRLVYLQGSSPKKSKYGNKEAEVSGHKFDSRKEARFFLQLQQDPTVKSIRTQVKYELIPKQEGERACVYVADFVVEYQDGEVVVYDVKGMRTALYIVKRKLMLWVHGMRIREV